MSTNLLDEFTKQAQHYLANIATKDIYDLTHRFIHLNFQRQGYHGDTGFTKWKPVSNKQNGQAILVQHGHLIKSFYPSYRPNQVDIITDIPYAREHNEGLLVNVSSYTRKRLRKASAIQPIIRKNGTKKAIAISAYNMGDDSHVKAHLRKYPKRQFMPILDELADAPILKNTIQKKLESELTHMFNKFP